MPVPLWKKYCKTNGTVKSDVRGYLEKCAQRSRLRKNKLDDVIDYCLTPDLTEVIPVFQEGQVVDIQRMI